jgi:hypothetical protein
MWISDRILNDRKMRLAFFCLIPLLIAALLFIKPGRILAPAPSVEPAARIDPWREAADKIEEERGEPTGREAQIVVPAQLRHYSDRRRFLAIQSAEFHEQKYSLPRDYADLIDMISRGQLVEMESLGDDYILYGAGESATDEMFTHYDSDTGLDIPLLETLEEYEKEHSLIVRSIDEQKQLILDIEAQLRRAGRDRALRKNLLAQLADARLSLQEIARRADALFYFYKDPFRLKMLLSERAAIYELARKFGDISYNLDDPAERRRFRIRLLSFIRPEARSVILEIARAYKAAFGRHLPITSLVRSEQYQARLSETNPNAARNSAPPHTTGLAFDVYYRYMTAAEQDWLMQEVARIESAGRVEALRETRDHIHIFVFPDGRPPAESLIQRSLGAGR